MSSDNKIAQFLGFIKITHSPAFIVPIFSIDGRPVFQQADSNKKLSGFVYAGQEDISSIQHSTIYNVKERKLDFFHAQKGHEAYYGFSVNEKSAIIDKYDNLVSWLKQRYAKNVFPNSVLKLEVLTFIEAAQGEINAAYNEATEILKQKKKY